MIAKLDWISIAGASKLGRILDVCVNKVRRKSAFGSLTHGDREVKYERICNTLLDEHQPSDVNSP